ncbi:hypothetical protein JOF28_000297 [Leucobacter exalbidus]|uniref:Uncharacterized protein n=1 Tax=Leucobacter exalbidus TaxID=662960 RepID=A0A940SZN0_9MICO|nr:hypothetical protein [Leucobacter exalbidus]MBP1325065.1 hypothetical protein [Leucobacter exalbidus]
MAETRLFEAERSAWIKGHRWFDKHSASQRAELLASQARKLDRTKAGLGDTAMHEAKLKSTMRLWAERSEDTGTSALGAVAYVMYTGLKACWFGVTWGLSWVLYKAWESRAATHRVMVLPYFVAAALVAVLFLLGRPAGGDLWLINTLASGLEASTGGWIAPRVLSGWYAAGMVSWLEIQIVLAFAAAGWRAYSWGWAAPAVRNVAQGQSMATDKGVKIISGQDAPDNNKTKASAEVDAGFKIISSPKEGSKNNV